MNRENEHFEKAALERNAAMPTAKNEDVEFSESLADAEDLEALERAEAADARQENE
ncbi:MAG: YfhD-like protein [Paenibacillus sp.]|jgi:hypothetical protein|nr:YfhD-like protein [Paenibacillus sp.]